MAGIPLPSSGLRLLYSTPPPPLPDRTFQTLHHCQSLRRKAAHGQRVKPPPPPITPPLVMGVQINGRLKVGWGFKATA